MMKVKTPFCNCALIMLLFLFVSTPATAIDIVTVNVGESENDTRVLFKNELVVNALELTKEEYGDYKIVENPNRMNIARAFRELQSGKNLSLTFAHTRPEFEQMARPVRVSIRSKVDSYRLLVVKKGQSAKFKDVKTLNDLAQFTIGLSPNWSTYKIMQENGFTIVDTPIYNSMFRMLEQGRFDFMPRAVNEVYDELALHKPVNEGLEIVPELALFIPSNSYMFVSPKLPRIFDRLNSGLHAMSLNGDLDKLNEQYFREFITRAKIQNRRILTVPHSQIPLTPSIEEPLVKTDIIISE